MIDEYKKEIIEEGGVVITKVCMIEEMSELTKELTKSLRGLERKKNILEEVAHVEMMLSMIKMIYDIDQEDIDIVIHDTLLRHVDIIRSKRSVRK